MGESVYIEGVYNRQVSASRTNFNQRRRGRNTREADELEQQGYTVERDLHPNGAYFAMIGNHPEHEQTIGRIFAENGLTFALDKEGNARTRIHGRLYILPSVDGRVEGYTHEIYALMGKPSAQKVADAISHTFKPFAPDRKRDVQASVAISFTPNGSQYKRSDIAAGVREYKRRLQQGETLARPNLYLHVNESTRQIYKWGIK